MISIGKRETKGLTHTRSSSTHTAMGFRANVKTSQAQARIMSRCCWQLWLLTLFVAFIALQQRAALAAAADAVNAYVGAKTSDLPTAAAAAAELTITNTTMTTTIALAMAKAKAKAMTSNRTMAELVSDAYEALKPTEIIATKTIARPTKAHTFVVVANNSSSSGGGDSGGGGRSNSGNNATMYWQSERKSDGNVTAGFAETLANSLGKVVSSNGNATMTQPNTSAAAAAAETPVMTSFKSNASGGQLEGSADTAEPSNMSFHEYCIANRDSFADLLTIVLYSIVCIVGLFGNTLVIYVVLRFSKMQTVTNIYILNLAIADECFLIGIPFLIYTMRICSWTFGEYMCKAYMVSTSITQFTSSIFLLIMSADRFIAVCHPIASPRFRTIRIAKLVSAIAWLTSAVLMLPVILFASTVTQEDGIHYSCNIEWPEAYNKHTGTTFILYTFFLGFAIPLCFILCFYYLVIRKLHAVGKKHRSKEKKRSHRKVTRLVLTVITVYVLCWLPQWISQVALIHSSPGQSDLSRFEVLLFLLFGCMAYSNSAMNPILYAFLSDNFRKSFFKAFTCMTGHEVNAQLQIEPSVFTKHGGSRRRGGGGSKRFVAQTTSKAKARAKSSLVPGTPGNNNSSTATSSTTTQADKHNVSVAVAVAVGPTTAAQTTITTFTTSRCGVAKQLNDSLTSLQSKRNGLINAEDVVLVLDSQQSICATLVDRGEANQNQNQIVGVGSTLQTDV